MAQKEIVALILAGGQGSRLGVLAENVAKPAVPFGGKYRIIDFALSNCINSGIDTVGVLTQYQPFELNKHIGIGRPWDLDRMNGGITILAPYMKTEKGEWYAGTADAVFQNIHYVDEMSSRYVIILSGDHIYKMDYNDMLEYHKEKHADATISVIDVPMEEAGRYGIMNTNRDGSIYEFEEKPENPKSTLASMGIYIFTWDMLREYLINDHLKSDTSHDFGKDIIPAMLKDKKRMFAYKFRGYWRDAGTISSYWESNLNLTEKNSGPDIYDPCWKIYSPDPAYPPHFVSDTGKVEKSVIADGCTIHGTVKNSVIFPGVTVNAGSVIEDSIIMSDTLIGCNTEICCSIIGENCVIGNEVKCGVGEFAENTYNPRIYNSNITVVGSNTIIPNNTVLGKNVVIGSFITPHDFETHYITSGGYVMKGGSNP